MHFYPHHIGDYRSATMHLSNEEDLAYRRLLEIYYDTEQMISDDLQLVARRIRVDVQALEFVLKEFFVPTTKGWKNKRCDLVIKDYQEMIEKNRRNGQKGGRPKKAPEAQENPVGLRSVSDGMPVETQRKANHKPRTINQEPKRKETGVSKPEDVSQEIWDSFVEHRKLKKAPITELVMTAITEQAKIAGWTLENALKETCVRGWQSFKAEWVAKKTGFVKPQTAAERATNLALGRPADHRLPTPEEQAEREKARLFR